MKIMRPVIAWLRQLGCRITTYIDDNLIMASTKEEANNLAEIAVTLLESLGFLVNPTKSVMPGNVVPGVLHQFVRHDNSGATTETPENAIVGEEPARCHLNHRKRTGQVCGNSVLDGSGNSSCTSVLQSAAACEELCDQDTERVRHSNSNRGRFEGGATVVVGPSPQLE